MPATPEVVGAYLAAAGEGYALPTLRRRVAAIARACGVAGHPLDTKHPAIRETLRGMARKHGTPARRAAALTTTEIRKLSRACGTTLAGARDRALFLIGFAGALRRSELVGLDMAHVTWTGESLTLLIERSKTDAEAKGAEINIPRGRSEETCPVTALQAWLTAGEITAGPLFRKVNRGGAGRDRTARHRRRAPNPVEARRRGRTEGNVGRAGEDPAWPAGRLCDHRLPQRRAGRGIIHHPISPNRERSQRSGDPAWRCAVPPGETAP